MKNLTAREQHPAEGGPSSASELRGWANAVSALRPGRDLAAFKTSQGLIAAGLRRAADRLVSLSGAAEAAAGRAERWAARDDDGAEIEADARLAMVGHWRAGGTSSAAAADELEMAKVLESDRD